MIYAGLIVDEEIKLELRLIDTPLSYKVQVEFTSEYSYAGYQFKLI